jgi:hypothetical protein
MVCGYLPAIITVAALLGNVLSQILSLLLFKKLGVLNSAFLGFILGFVIVCRAASLECFVTYVALSYCYFHFINMGETARRVRILAELRDSKEGLSEKEILERYNSKEIVEKRITRLVKNRQVVIRDNKYYIAAPVMLFASKIMLAFKFILFQER